MILDLSLKNHSLYQGLQIGNLAGKLTLVTPPDEAIPVITANLDKQGIDPKEVILTGGIPISPANSTASF